MINWETSFVSFSGRMYTPNDESFSSFCKAFNGNFKKRPACILFPKSENDVASVLLFAKNNNFKVSVHNGGHSTIASGLNNNHLVLNMRDMAGVSMSEDQNTIVVGAGALAHEIDDVTTKFGKAIPLGDCPVVGISGLTLGGGIGFLSRSVGLTCDYLIGAKVVTPTGEILTCNKNSNNELFTLLKGAGQGNFGVVTELTFTMVDIPTTVYGGNICWHLDDAKEILSNYDQLLKEAPNELNLYARVNEEMGPMVKVYGMYNGDPSIGKQYFDTIRSWGETIFDNAKEYSYQTIQKINETTIVDSPCFLWKNGLIDETLSSELIQTLLSAYSNRPTPYCRLNIDTIGGAVQKPKELSAFAHRNSTYVLSVMGVWFDVKDKNECIRWAKETMTEIEPYLNGKIYVNYADPECANNPEKYYGSTGKRVLEMKQQMDSKGILIGTLNPERSEFS